jgi:hypothetical protein
MYVRVLICICPQLLTMLYARSGFGSYMGNSPMIIMWPNEDGSFTLSQRKAPYETEPKVDADPPFAATFLAEQSLVVWPSLPSNRICFWSHQLIYSTKRALLWHSRCRYVYIHVSYYKISLLKLTVYISSTLPRRMARTDKSSGRSE